MKYLSFAGLLLILLVGSCKTTNQLQEENRKEEIRKIMDSWMGHHKSELIRQWGPPDRYESDGKGGEILIYESKQTRGAVMYGTYIEKTTYPYKMFYADPNGKLYHWRTGTR